MKARGIMLLWHSMRHTRVAQLWHRARLTARRKFAATVLRRVTRPRPVVSERPPPLRDPLPAPDLGSERPARILRGPDGAPIAKLLGGELALTPPIDWRATGFRNCKNLARLAVHYLEFLTDVDDDEFFAISADWIDRHPRHAPGCWVREWNAYGLSIRCVVWMQELARRGLAGDARSARIVGALHAQLRFLARNLELDLGGNHLLKDCRALLWGAAFFAGAEADGWRRRATSLLRRELDEQILADGVHFELSPAYHAQVFDDLLDCAEVIDPDDATYSELRWALDAMARALVDLTHPDGDVALFNDGGLHTTCGTVASSLARYRRCFERPADCAAPRAAFALTDAGYYGVRDPERGDYFIVDAGRPGPDHLPAHAHGDALSFEWSVATKRIVVDFGVFEYDRGAWRDMSRATLAHNTVGLGNDDQSEFWSSFRMARRARVWTTATRIDTAAPRLRLAASHDGYRRLAGRPIHTRRVDATPDRIRIEDEIRAGAGQPVQSTLLLHPDCAVDVDGTVATITRGDVTVRVTASVPLRSRVHRWCPDFGVAFETRQLVLFYGFAPTRGAFELRVVKRG